MKQKYFGACNKWHWGEAPQGFDERVHFLQCPVCDEPAFLMTLDPRDAGYMERDKVELRVVKQP